MTGKSSKNSEILVCSLGNKPPPAGHGFAGVVTSQRDRRGQPRRNKANKHGGNT